MEYENWYNNPFVHKLLTDYKKRESLSRFNNKGKLVCTKAKDGRKQKSCRYYYRNGLTKKCLFLEKGLLCEAREED